ncbi:MAG: hypothetical protein MJ196_06475 [Treponemataceae bacterium]|nr:hypothetical protein [Treponemataceae bacterium]
MEEKFDICITTNALTKETKCTITKKSNRLKFGIVNIVCVLLCCLSVLPISYCAKQIHECFGKNLCIIFLVLAICLIIIIVKQLLTYNIKKEKIAFLKELYYVSKTDNLTNNARDIIDAITSAVQEL